MSKFTPMTKEEIDEFLEGSTFGAEMELGDCRRDTVLPDGYTFCYEEGCLRTRYNMGNDPKGEYSLIGGEVQLSPANSEEDLINNMMMILDITKSPYMDTVNYGTFHIHIKIPKLLDDRNVEVLRHLINYSKKWDPLIIPYVSYLPDIEDIKNKEYKSEEQKALFIREFKERKWSRHCILPDSSIERVNNPELKTIDDLVNSMPPQSKKDGKPLFALLTRASTNYRKLRSSDIGTIEFRLFGGTRKRELIENVVRYVKRYITHALMDSDSIIEDLSQYEYPRINMPDESNEDSLRWLNTNHDKGNREEIISYLEESLKQEKIYLYELGYPEVFWRKRLGNDLYNHLEQISISKEKTNE